MFSSNELAAKVGILGVWAGILLAAVALDSTPAVVVGIMFSSLLLMRQALQTESVKRFDQLTGLFTRATFQNAVTKDLERNPKRVLAIVYLDLDRFETFNSSLGTEAGDKLLISVADRLESVLPGCAFLGRTGGDEFSIALPTPKEKIAFTLEEIRTAFASPFCIEETCVEISLSMGVAFFPEDATSAVELMQYAAIAEREAKFLRKGYVLYTHELGGEYRSELPLRAAIREGLDQEQFYLEYQPKVRVENTDTPIGAEALIRWEPPTMGRVAPDQFIGATEQQGMIQPVTEWVLRTAIRDLIKFRMSGIALSSISVNISPYALFNQDLLDVVDKILQAEHLDPSALVLEVTETSIHLDNERLIQVLIKLEEKGVNISIDDFGTGQGALVYLRYLPTSEIKIDRTFVVNMRDNKQDYSIVKSLVHLAQDLGCEVCAEGVEDGDTLELLKEMGCDLAQGYFISRPLPYKAFVAKYGIKEL